ncbi:MAG: T9SS type A sorting domain-containing protein, partial [Bacteroidia bacterium]|nr:T9SS type A sorting domain-containing protein [Bacteroidia bacterium]
KGNQADLDASLDTNGGASATDKCTGVTWTNDFTELSDDCGATGSATVIFTATDGCGNKSETSATFTIEDTTPPTIDPGASNLTVECDGEGNQADLEAWLASNGGASATDICSDVSWSYDCGEQESGIVFNCVFDPQGENQNAVITFGPATGTDGGYDTFDNGTGLFFGNLPGIYEYGLSFNLQLNRWECHELSTEPLLIWYSEVATPSPSCDPADWTDAGPFCQLLEVDCPEECKLTDECGATGSVTVVFTATDECGNSTDTIATFTIEDTTNPVITTPPADLTVECDGAGNQAELDAWLDSFAGAVGEDLCGDATWSHNFTALSDDCGATGSAMVEFTLTDECGNDVKDTATFTIVDTTPPSIDVEASDLTVVCGPDNAAELQNWLDTIGLTGAASDECSDIAWTNDFAGLSDLCGLTGAATVEFTATDECGLTSKTTATFTIEDTTPPVLVGEEPGNLNGLNACYNEMPEPPSLEEIAALFFEECGEVIVELNSNPVGDDCGWSVLHIYTIKDECDNYAADEIKIFYSGGDDTKPEIWGVPGDEIADCENVPEAPEVTATDNCGKPVDLQYSGDVITPGNCDGNYTITRTWTATDECGNQTVESYTIDVQDNTPPALTGQLPPFETWGINSCQPEGDYGPSAQDIADQYTDNCSGVMVTKEIKSNNGTDCGWIIDIEYVVKDNCGNVADTFKLWFAGEDMNPPTIVQSQECLNEDFLLTTSDGADCPADAGTSLVPGHTVDKNNPDFTVAGLPFGFGGLNPCFEDDCTDKNDLRFVVDTVDVQKDDCPAVITITFDVLDICGNAYEDFVCVFYVTDNELPVLDCPEGADLGQDPAADPQTGIPYGLVDKVPYTDNCDPDGLTTTFSDDVTSEPGSVTNSAGFFRINCLFTTGGIFSEFVYYQTGYDPNGYATYETNGIPGFPGFEAEVVYNDVEGRFESTLYFNGQFDNVSWVNYTTEYYPSCNTADWIVVNQGGCVLDVICYPTEVIDYTLVRTFTYTDACGNEGTCDVTYTWSETFDLPNQANSSSDLDQNASGENPSILPVNQSASADNSVEIDFTAYPVPFDKEVSVKYNFEFDTDVTIQVFDTKGLLIMSETHNNSNRNMDHTTKLDLSRGGDQVFYIHLTTNKGTVVKKVVSSGLKRN